MKFSQAHIPTLREPPHDAEVISHKLLTRAGMIRKVAMGIYNFLPLGLRSLKKIKNIVREEMNLAGAQEILMPNLIPAELWQESGRWQKYGPELLRIKDRHKHEYCFGPTHEEIVCAIVRHERNSWRDYPINLYQIQTKFRDEIRPRFGLMRGREFLMKDAYSFHTSNQDLDREYQNMFDTYKRVFERCGLASRAVEADTGTIGGSSSHEFMVLADTGEDAIASCTSCDYAANLEKATFHIPEQKHPEAPPIAEVHTPGQKSIEDVAKFLATRPSAMIKTLLYLSDLGAVLVCLAGHRELNEIKLKNLLNCDWVRLPTDADLAEVFGADARIPIGFLGPIEFNKQDYGKSVRILFDHSLLGIASGITGANKPDHHLKNVDVLRDLKMENPVDVSTVLEGDRCPRCATGELKILRGIEVGHIFKLGTRYSEPMKVTFLDEDGKENPVTMGCYGIGVSRTLAACVEQNHDDAGIIWPRAIAPFDLHLLTMGPDPEIHEAGNNLYRELWDLGFEILWDDRNERAGVKFNDADLIGLPLQIVIGKKSLAANQVEYKIRRTGAKGTMARDGIGSSIEDLIENL